MSTKQPPPRGGSDKPGDNKTNKKSGAKKVGSATKKTGKKN